MQKAKSLTFAALGAAALLSACTTNPKVAAISKPAIVVAGKNADSVIAKMTEICDRNDLTIEDRSNGSLVCSKDAPLGAQLLLGTDYGTDVKSHVRFNAFPVDGGIKVVAYAWYETQNAFGQTNKVDINGGASRGQIQTMLDQAKAELGGK